MSIQIKTTSHFSDHPAIAKPKARIAKHRYDTPLFVMRETFSAFKLHNGWGLSASLSFYAMIAIIPMALLMFFFLSHLVFSSHTAVVNLASITSSLEPKLSRRIMLEIHKVAEHKTAWSTLGTIALFWFAIPLASTLRSAFETIFAITEHPSFIRKSIQDILSVIGILFVFFMFTFFDLMLEKASQLLGLSFAHASLTDSTGSFMIITILLGLFYRAFLPINASFKTILTGSMITALLWMAMRPIFSEVLSVNHTYGAVFGGMKNVFISLAWLYYTFAIFLLGTELISTLKKRDVLLLRCLFNDVIRKNPDFISKVMSRHGCIYQSGEVVFNIGDEGRDLYYVADGRIKLVYENRLIRHLSAGDFFGEMAILGDSVRIADAIVDSDFCDIIVINANNIQTLILNEPKVAMSFLRHMALQLKNSQQSQP
ncbi:YhjD/YihY/BrkB family envelope integrity protein [Candidatus Methylopumilus turicensis]|uniref:Cyclic nucleotide-binding protein n=1 Tax=Candidatus Methylopumilus turicensis TaxID=1581680 RepID=A0A0B7J1K0_9PROT|nr:YhjD/YihY/BrkB family envelope integrity protein [Candidatus Methylopumilus turicensis]CEN56613.1 Cyclic nucleotide-binding protein [Candidatus Methylopumilus turicensis]